MLMLRLCLPYLGLVAERKNSAVLSLLRVVFAPARFGFGRGKERILQRFRCCELLSRLPSSGLVAESVLAALRCCEQDKGLRLPDQGWQQKKILQRFRCCRLLLRLPSSGLVAVRVCVCVCPVRA